MYTGGIVVRAEAESSRVSSQLVVGVSSNAITNDARNASFFFLRALMGFTATAINWSSFSCLFLQGACDLTVIPMFNPHELYRLQDTGDWLNIHAV
jgi:hypothetical protein